jgi:hypothetical protein
LDYVPSELRADWRLVAGLQLHSHVNGVFLASGEEQAAQHCVSVRDLDGRRAGNVDETLWVLPTLSPLLHQRGTEIDDDVTVQ